MRLVGYAEIELCPLRFPRGTTEYRRAMDDESLGQLCDNGDVTAFFGSIPILLFLGQLVLSSADSFCPLDVGQELQELQNREPAFGGVVAGTDEFPIRPN
jgi:hypothetical protein